MYYMDGLAMFQEYNGAEVGQGEGTLNGHFTPTAPTYRDRHLFP